MPQVSLTKDRADDGATARPVVFLPTDGSSSDHRAAHREGTGAPHRPADRERIPRHPQRRHTRTERAALFRAGQHARRCLCRASRHCGAARPVRRRGALSLHGHQGDLARPDLSRRGAGGGLAAGLHRCGARRRRCTASPPSRAPTLEEAAALLLERGRVRLKAPAADGGAGQSVVADQWEFDQALAAADEADIGVHGLVIEEDLADVTTYSVGEIRIGDALIAYCGTQRTDTGRMTMRSPMAARACSWCAAALPSFAGARLAPLALQAASLAHLYDRSGERTSAGPDRLPPAHYDVAAGKDGRGMLRVGVLEQSWRLGGASGAEIAAFEAFKAAPAAGRGGGGVRRGLWPSRATARRRHRLLQGR